ncbi:hypothetical protein CEXT_198131 [Caerostris extrusa]|uniref:Uncharacterized protein n=1 Tax=Caerostris extrusa TaxID=172846 RepID=A0AAV4N7F5_CAEEX|nr:hypothetical protein CEXT_198131 [Caerostris extrusa]
MEYKVASLKKIPTTNKEKKEKKKKKKQSVPTYSKAKKEKEERSGPKAQNTTRYYLPFLAITIPISADEGPGLWAPPSLLHCSSRECVPAFRFLAAVFSSFDSVYEIPLLRFGRRKEKKKKMQVCVVEVRSNKSMRVEKGREGWRSRSRK